MLQEGVPRRARAFPLPVAALVAAAAVALVPGRARADARTEAAAVDAIKQASSDYLSMDYATALSRLQKASKACGTSKCTPPTRAALLRDIGTMQFRKGDQAGAR